MLLSMAPTDELQFVSFVLNSFCFFMELPTLLKNYDFRPVLVICICVSGCS